MVHEDESNAAQHSAFRRVLGNIAWLLSGKGFGAVVSLVYLAILSRSLGLKGFGHFSLIFATAQAMVALVGFQTWQTVVRYGAAYVHNNDWLRFGRLTMLCALIDAMGALAGCLIAYVIFYHFADALDINPDYRDMSFAFTCAFVWGRVSTPTGVARVLDRFDLAVYIEGVVPTMRLVAAGAIWLIGPTVGRYLFAWATIDLLVGAIFWAMAHRLAPQSVRLGFVAQWRTALSENERIRSFLGVTFVTSTLDAIFKQSPLLAVGYFLGTSAAGVYRLADQLAQGFGKVAQLLARAIYSEVARLIAAATYRELRRLIGQVTGMAAIGGLCVVTVAYFAGEQLIALIGGSKFSGGAIYLIPLAIAASLELGRVMFEPVLHTTGHAIWALFARIIEVAALGAAIAVLVSSGAIGIAWSVTCAAIVGYATLLGLTVKAMRGVRNAMAASDAPS